MAFIAPDYIAYASHGILAYDESVAVFSISDVVPSGSIMAGDTIYVVGTGFDDTGNTIEMIQGSTTVSLTAVTEGTNRITFLAPRGYTGEWAVKVTKADASSETKLGAFAYAVSSVTDATVKNLATAKLLTGAGSQTTGPDGNSDSAITITTPVQFGNDAIDEGTLLLWYKSGYTIPGYSLTQVGTSGSWILGYYQGDIPVNLTLPAGDVFSARLYSTTISSAAMTYLLNDMTKNSGYNTEPMW